MIVSVPNVGSAACLTTSAASSLAHDGLLWLAVVSSVQLGLTSIMLLWLACRMYAAAAARSDGLLLLSGGRDISGVPRGDAFGLARHRDGRWEWAAAPGSIACQCMVARGSAA